MVYIVCYVHRIVSAIKLFILSVFMCLVCVTVCKEIQPCHNYKLSAFVTVKLNNLCHRSVAKDLYPLH